MRLSTLLITGACAVSLARCSHDSNTLTVSPPLPPAEEPPDTPSAYVSDGGAVPGEENRREDDESPAEGKSPSE